MAFYYSYRIRGKILGGYIWPAITVSQSLPELGLSESFWIVPGTVQS